MKIGISKERKWESESERDRRDRRVKNWKNGKNSNIVNDRSAALIRILVALFFREIHRLWKDGIKWFYLKNNNNN